MTAQTVFATVNSYSFSVMPLFPADGQPDQPLAHLAPSSTMPRMPASGISAAGSRRRRSSPAAALPRSRARAWRRPPPWPRGLSLDAPLRLCRHPLDGLDRGRRHARHPDPALGGAAGLRHPDRDLDLASSSSPASCPADRHRALHADDRDHRPAAPRMGPAGGAARAGQAAPPALPRSGRCWRCSWSSWAASMAASSRRPRRRASARSARFSSRWRAGADLAELFDTLVETAVTSAMIFFVIIGAMVLGNFLNIAGLPRCCAS
jgi:hypothetical protein